MPIWMGDLDRTNKLSDDKIVLYWGLWPGNDGTTPLAQKVQDDGHLDGPPWTWEGEAPPEHPDDIGAGQRYRASDDGQAT